MDQKGNVIKVRGLTFYFHCRILQWSPDPISLERLRYETQITMAWAYSFLKIYDWAVLVNMYK